MDVSVVYIYLAVLHMQQLIQELAYSSSVFRIWMSTYHCAFARFIQLCNHPSLIHEKCLLQEDGYEGMLGLFPPGFNNKTVQVTLRTTCF